MGARTRGNWRKWNSCPISQVRLLRLQLEDPSLPFVHISTNGWQEGNDRPDKQETREALAVYSWINTAKGFLKSLPAKIYRKLLSMSRNQPKIMTGLLKGHCHLDGHPFKLGLAQCLGCGRCKQAYEMAAHILCDCETLTTSRFMHLG